jgi:hypothetical protein
MKKIEIDTKVINGRMSQNRPLILKALKAFEGINITVTIAKRKKKRSTNQNSYYWAVIVPFWKQIFLDEWGEVYSQSQTHEFLKYNCNFVEKINKETGEIIRVSKSTTENSTTDQELMCKQARDLALEMFNIEIPLPNTQMDIIF